MRKMVSNLFVFGMMVRCKRSWSAIHERGKLFGDSSVIVVELLIVNV